MIIAFIQARMGSKRLPGKVMLPLDNLPVIDHVYRRVSMSKGILKVKILTSSEKNNYLLTEHILKKGYEIFVGSEENVLDRFYKATIDELLIEKDLIVRITADCPLIDHKVIDSLIDFHIKGDYDYSSNTVDRTFPDGLDCEIFSVKVLNQVYENAIDKYDKEHVTPFIYKNPNLFSIGHFKHYTDLSHLRWTLDTIEDYVKIQQIFEKFNKNIDQLSLEEIVIFEQGLSNFKS